MVLEFGLLKSSLFPESDALGEGLGTDPETVIAATEGTNCVSGQYTGDGQVSMNVTGLGFQPRLVLVWRDGLATGAAVDFYMTTDQDGNRCIVHLQGNTNFKIRREWLMGVITDGFVVGDNNANQNPNANGVTYQYVALR